MIMASPPRVATWLLRRLAGGPQPEAVVGDLIEQYQRRQSAAWFWWQAVASIAAGAVHDLREHFWFVLRAIALWYALAWPAAAITETVHGWFGLEIWNWTVVHGWDTFRSLWFARPKWGIPPLLLMSCVNAAMIGWIVARFHRRHAAAVLTGCAAFSIGYLLVSRWSGRMLWPVVFGPMPYVPLIADLVALIAAPVCFIIGGLFGSRPLDEDTEPDPSAFNA